MAIRESFLSELLATFFGEFGGKMLQETIKGEIKSGAGFFGNHLNNLIKQNPRAQLLSVLLRLEPEDMEKFWKHHSEAMEGRIPTWSENSLTVVLGNALPRKALSHTRMLTDLGSSICFSSMRSLNTADP